MKKKAFAAIALTSCIALTATFTGCSLTSTNSRRDMEQVIATVDISKTEKFESEFKNDLEKYKSVVNSTNIVKRELVSYFINVGYSYVQNGYTYEYTFNALLDALVNNAILVQYSTVALLNEAAESNPSILKDFEDAEGKVAKYELLLDAVDKDAKNLATYKFYSSVNSAIDNYEKSVIEDEDGYKGTETRTTPTNLNTEQDDYYPKKKSADGEYVEEDGKYVLDYHIYTGYGDYTLKNSGAYVDDALDGTTRKTRIKAYNIFINNLRRNHLVDGNEKLTDVLDLPYMEKEYVSQLETQIVNAYYDLYEEQKEDLLKGEYIDNVYQSMLAAQKSNYDKSTSAFDTAMSSMSSSSFILYSPDTADSSWNEVVDESDSNISFAKFGFIYNILLPFSAKQSNELNALKSQQTDDGNDDSYFRQRNELLKQIYTTDQRSAWFNGATDYSFTPEDNNFFRGRTSAEQEYRKYLFFEDNLTNSGEGGRYKKLQAYDGRYSYNGHVIENEDESYTLVANKLDIDGMLDEFTAYVNYVLGSDKASYTKTSNYYDKDKTFSKKDDEDEIDYSNFIYAEGKVSFDKNAANLMYPESDQFKAMSAVNELQFAYTTDTSVLSNYIGYSLSAYDTNYIKEFEYAAKKAVGQGVGSFVVCAGDYGWHLIYVTHVFDFGENGENYKPDWNRIDVEGTFENLFYEMVKNNDLTDISTTRRTQILNIYNQDTAVTKYQKRYQDLLDLGNN